MSNDKDRILRKGQLPPHMREILKKRAVITPINNQVAEENKRQNASDVNAALIEQLFIVCRQMLQLLKDQDREIQQIKQVLLEGAQAEKGEQVDGNTDTN